MSTEQGIEREIETACIAILAADAEIAKLKPDLRTTLDMGKIRAAVQCVVECDQLNSANLGETGRGIYYTVRLSVMSMTSLDSDAEGSQMQRIAHRVRQILMGTAPATWTAALTLSAVHGVVGDNVEQLYEPPIVGRAHVVMLHISEV